MKNELGTPTTLQEAIDRELCIAPLSTLRERLYTAIKDYTAQKFTTVMMTGIPDDEQVRLMKLFNMIFDRTT